MRTALLALVTATACTGGIPGEAGVGPVERERPLDEIALLFAHNAMSSVESGFIGPNQNLGYEAQLELGVRGFMLDVHDDGGVASLCHSNCTFGSEPLVEGFARFADWLEAHPDDVLVFILQDEIAPPAILAAVEATGLDRWAITPPSGPWPLWSELIDADTRLLLTTERAHEDVPAWYASTYSLAWDTPYAAQTVDDFSCEPLRGATENPIFLVNHFLTAPIASEALASNANQASVLEARVADCEAAAGRPVTWLALDFVDMGAGIETVDALNER